MCGIAGLMRREPRGVDVDILLRMIAVLRHRGPDGYGVFTGSQVGLAHARLSIIDVTGGAQPLTNEDGRIAVTFNGEIFNYVELREELAAAGHTFRTRSDTEVLVHGYEQWGHSLVERLNGQFAFAIYDGRDRSLFLARDRFGIRPLFYCLMDGNLWFASEAKALFATGAIEASPDLAGLDEVFTFWAARAPRTVFEGVSQLEPGSFGVWREGSLRLSRYYSLDYPEAREEVPGAIDQLDSLMRGGVQLQMRSDVAVGGYLSGGLDSSITCALAAGMSPFSLRTFSVSFEDPRFDESAFQRLVAAEIASTHAVQMISRTEIGDVFPDVIWHTETPVVRTAPAPMFLLSRLTAENGVKVVLTGEGADELFLGYDLFKETAVRTFCLRQPHSARRPRLFDRLYPYLLGPGTGGGEMWRRFFLEAGPLDDPLFSHLPRFGLTSRIKDAYSEATRAALSGHDSMEELREALPPAFYTWSELNRAAYLEMTTLLPGYLLSSQGERMGMAHSVEGRYPFLDHRLFEFSAGLPTRSKLRGLREKDILRRWAAPILLQSVGGRGKQPYRAPDVPAFFHANQPGYVEEVLGEASIARVGLFDGRAVAGLVRRCRAGQATGFRENQAFVAILSTQLWHQEFIDGSRTVIPQPIEGADVVLHEMQSREFQTDR
ncbi:MAG TPA: asparagine synthase (glutamine-hydrolyzing) [Nitrospira sp.]|nr:asparagine synthase (glutamine-hydrolyzing) [Nitrospira sp.]